MWIVVGLGNPGAQYARDRHNIGFRVLEALCEKAGGRWYTSQFQSLLSKIECGGSQVCLVLPQTFMNLSGEALFPLVRFYQVEPAQVLVVHDDLELPFGRFLLKRGGGESGHRGLLSITEALKSRDYLRLRFGIGRPSTADISISDYVLSPFSEEEEAALPELIENAVMAITCCCSEGEVQAMNQFNRRKKTKTRHPAT